MSYPPSATHVRDRSLISLLTRLNLHSKLSPNSALSTHPERRLLVLPLPRLGGVRVIQGVGGGGPTRTARLTGCPMVPRHLRGA